MIDEVIGTQSFSKDKVNEWASAVVEQCVSGLAKREQNFKYIGKVFDSLLLFFGLNKNIFVRIVDALIVQRTGGGIHSECSCFWNDESDGSCTVSWKNKSMICIVTVFGLLC